MNNLPGVRLTMANAGETLSGTIVFYSQERGDATVPWHLAGQYELPILAPRVDGKTLSFETPHHTCHGCR
jgi:hypothetical protein